MGRDVVHHQRYPQLKQFYSLTENFLYRYNYKFTLPRHPSTDHVTAKASQDVNAFKAYTHEMFHLSFNFLHPTPKDVQCNNFKVHETKLIHIIVYYAYLRDNLPHENFIYVNDQMTSPYYMKFAYIIKDKYMKGTLRNFDPVKKYYNFQPIENPERPLIVPIEVLEPAENYHTNHIYRSVQAKPVKKFIEYIGSRRPTDQEIEVQKAVKATVPHKIPNLLHHAPAYFLSQNKEFVKEFEELKQLPKYPQQTKMI